MTSLFFKLLLRTPGVLKLWIATFLRVRQISKSGRQTLKIIKLRSYMINQAKNKCLVGYFQILSLKNCFRVARFLKTIFLVCQQKFWDPLTSQMYSPNIDLDINPAHKKILWQHLKRTQHGNESGQRQLNPFR